MRIRAERREKKKRNKRKMKVDGASVKRLGELKSVIPDKKNKK